MKAICKTSMLMLLAVAMLASCSKKSTPTPTVSAKISLLAGTWATNEWGGVSGDDLSFNIDTATAAGTVTVITGAGYGFSVGNVIFSNIKGNADGTYSCTASYSATGSGALSTRPATITLSNNLQISVYYPALNASFPAITYVFSRPV